MLQKFACACILFQPKCRQRAAVVAVPVLCCCSALRQAAIVYPLRAVPAQTLQTHYPRSTSAAAAVPTPCSCIFSFCLMMFSRILYVHSSWHTVIK